MARETRQYLRGLMNTRIMQICGVAALLAEAACKSASSNVRINVASLEDRSRGERLVIEAKALVERATTTAQFTAELVEKSL